MDAASHMANRIKTECLAPDRSGIERAARLLREGRTVAIPTETVYGLAADATSDKAVALIYAAKERPSFNPLIVHVPSIDAARALAEFDDDAERLADAFWPGPLTLVLPVKAGAVSPLVTAGGKSVAIRVPDHPLARQVLAAAGIPLAAPSANPSGRISPTRAAHVLTGLSGRIAAVLDGGPTGVGVESTIIGLSPPTLLRAGGLPVEAIEACLGHALAQRTEDDAITAPGQLASHYAPGASVRLAADHAEAGEYMIGFGKVTGDVNLSPGGDLTEAAANLFDALHRADESGRPIAVAAVPDTGLGRAINDRLRRAAAPR